MPNPHTVSPPAKATGPIVAVTLTMHLDLSTITGAQPSELALSLANATLRICEDEPNAALRSLVGIAIESAAAGSWSEVQTELGAAVAVLGSVARSQLQGVTR